MDKRERELLYDILGGALCPMHHTDADIQAVGDRKGFCQQELCRDCWEVSIKEHLDSQPCRYVVEVRNNMTGEIATSETCAKNATEAVANIGAISKGWYVHQVYPIE